MNTRTRLICATAALAAAVGCSPEPVVVEAPPGQVNIYRDDWGMPHVYAEREEDGFWGLGYSEAADRLYGILFNYLAVRGELASRFGEGPTDIDGRTSPSVRMAGTGAGFYQWGGPVEGLVEQDIHARRWRYLQNARENFTSLTPQVQANLTAYVAGIRRYMDEHPNRVPAWAPELEPALVAAVSRQFIMSGVGICDQLLGSAGVASARDEDRRSGLAASNAFALAPERTEAGAVIFASDSHGPVIYGAGALLLGARIKAGPIDAFVVNSAGVPIGLKGHSRHFGWGITEGPRFPSARIAGPTQPDDPTAYTVAGEVRRMIVEPYVVEVAGGDPVSGEFHYTEHNGVLSPVVRREGNTAYVVSSANMGRAGAAVEQFREMLLAGSSEELERALVNRDIYPANIIMGGSDGSIRYIRPGRTPIRPNGADGMSIVNGSTSATAWPGIRSYEELLHVVDPEEGYLSNSNISPDMMFAEPKIDPADYPPDFGFEPGFTGTRQLRSIQLLEGDGRFSFEDAVAAIVDVQVLGHDRWNRAFGALRERFAGEPALQDPAFAAFYDELTNFDGDFLPESRGALAHHLTRNTLRETHGEAAFPLEMAVHDGEPLTGDQQARLFAATVAAHERLKGRPDGATATFGDVYRVGRGDVREPSRGTALMTGQGMISFFPSAYAPDGDSGSYLSVGGARFPFIVQFTDPLRSMSAAAYGASDDPESPHYSDQSVLRGPGELRSNYFNADELAGVVQSSETVETGIGVASPGA